MKVRFIYPVLFIVLLLSGCSQTNIPLNNEEDIAGIDTSDSRVVDNIINGQEYIEVLCDQKEIDKGSCNVTGYLDIGRDRVSVEFDDSGGILNNNENIAYILTEYGVGKNILTGQSGKIFISKMGGFSDLYGSIDKDNVHIGDKIHLRTPILQSQGGDYLSFKVIDIHLTTKDVDDNNIISGDIKIIQNDGETSRMIIGESIKE